MRERETGESGGGRNCVAGMEIGNFSVNIPHPTEQRLISELTFHFDAHNVMSCYDSQAEEEAATEARPIGASCG